MMLSIGEAPEQRTAYTALSHLSSHCALHCEADMAVGPSKKSSSEMSTDLLHSTQLNMTGLEFKLKRFSLSLSPLFFFHFQHRPHDEFTDSHGWGSLGIAGPLVTTWDPEWT